MSTFETKLMPALYGGIIIGVISAVPVLNFVNCLCCAGVLLGGFLSVMFYTKDLPEGATPLTSNDALRLGAMAGVIGAILGTIFTGLVLALFGNISAEILVSWLERSNVDIPADAMDQIRESMDQGITVFNLITSLIVDTLFGLLGGLIGYSVFKPKPLPINYQPPAPPMH